MKAIIIDDERKGRETLEELLKRYCPEVEIQAMAASAEEGYECICKYQPDIVFLDIEMPGEDGFSVLQRFEQLPFQVVFVTAHDSYSLKAIKYHAFDYLLKPVDKDELKKTLGQLKNQLAVSVDRLNEFMLLRKLTYTGRIALPIKEGIVYLKVADIIRIDSDGSYSTFYAVDEKKYVVSKNLKEYEDLLPSTHFFRSHKSHLINIYRVKKYLRSDGYFVEMEDGSTVEIARRKKDEFLEIMHKLE